MRCAQLLIACSLLLTALAGCRTAGKLKLASGSVITPPTQAEQPTTTSESSSQQTLLLPAGSTIRVESTMESPQAPASTTTTYVMAKDTQQTVQSSAQTISLSPTRKPDTTVALHKIDVAERRILLYISIGCLLAGIALKALLPTWPGAAVTSWIASGILFAAWKFSEVPWWASLLAAGLYFAIAGGYKRAEVDEKAAK